MSEASAFGGLEARRRHCSFDAALGESNRCWEPDCTPLGLAMYCPEEAKSRAGLRSRSRADLGALELAMADLLKGKTMRGETSARGEQLCHDSGQHRLVIPRISGQRRTFSAAWRWRLFSIDVCLESTSPCNR